MTPRAYTQGGHKNLQAGPEPNRSERIFSRKIFTKGNKRGSHVGMVLSFALFVTFLVFLYSILEPAIGTPGGKESFLDSLRIDLLEDVSSEVNSMTLKTGTIGTCAQLSGFDNLLSNSRLKIKQEDGGVGIAEFSGGNLLIDADGTFFKVYHSEDFEVGDVTASCPVETYTLGLVRTKDYVLETKVLSLIEEYKNDYFGLEERLKIPPGSDFGFIFTYANGTSVETQKKEIPVDVYAREIPVQYFDKEANILLGVLNLRVW
jgi:hypothetical protein